MAPLHTQTAPLDLIGVPVSQCRASCDAAAMIAAPVMSNAGSSVCHDRTSSTKLAVEVSNAANLSTPFVGHLRTPSCSPPSPPSKFELSLGPFTTAPTAMDGPTPCRLPLRFATWCCMQSGNVEPSPTMKLVPHAFAPNSQSRCSAANPSKRWSPVNSVYQASTAIHPNVCESTSNWLMSPAARKVSPAACVTPSSTCRLTSLIKAALLTASVGVPAATIACTRSVCASALVS